MHSLAIVSRSTRPTRSGTGSRLGSVLVLAALVAFCAGAPAANAALSDPAPQNPFSAQSVWNAPLPNNAPLAANSATLVAGLANQVQTYGTWINARYWSTPIYQVPIDQPTTRVYVDHATAMYTNASDAANLADQFAAVPIPASAQAAQGDDHHMIIWQPSTDTEWEMWLARQELTLSGLQWHIGWGARIQHVSQSSGIPPYPFGATASGLSELGGLMTANEISNTYINHALAIAVPQTAGQYTWPADRTDGTSTAANAIPEGTQFRLDPNLNLASLNLTPLGRAIAVAAQRYGLIVRDTAGAVAFYAEDPMDVGLGDYNWGPGGDPASALANFPWNSLQVIAAPSGTSSSPSSSPSPPSSGGCLLGLLCGLTERIGYRHHHAAALHAGRSSRHASRSTCRSHRTAARVLSCRKSRR